MSIIMSCKITETKEFTAVTITNVNLIISVEVLLVELHSLLSVIFLKKRIISLFEYFFSGEKRYSLYNCKIG